MRLWRAWVALLATREDGTSLALLRAALGACVLISLSTAVHADLVGVIWVDEAHGGLRALSPSPLVAWLGGATPEVAWRVVAATALFGAMTLTGLGGRLGPFLTLQTYSALVETNGHAGGSYDPLLLNGLWLCVLGDTTRTLSLDARLRTGAFVDPTPVAAWPRYLAIYQLVLVYWTTGLQKVSIDWVPGGDFSALYYILQQPTWARWDLSWLAWVFPLTQLATAVTWCWEVGAPIWLLAYAFRYTADRPGRLRAWSNRVDLRSWWAAVGVGFHVALLVLMDVGPFTFVSLAFYAAVWTPAEWRSLAARLRYWTTSSPAWSAGSKLASRLAP